ncbi:MAG: Mth938-like domain-containing protein [Candidatus Bipolaricaulota bacterium]
MLIESYSFGRMVIDGEEYQNDLMIYADEIHPKWIRKSGHELVPEDLAWIVERNPDLLIVGKGSSGLMEVTDRTRAYLKENDIDLWIGKTDEAVNYFNSEMDSDNRNTVSAAFHLTC